MLVEVTDGAYRRGQVWTYRTRPGEEGSRVVVGRVDRLPAGHLIVHIAVVGVRMRRSETDYQDRIFHAPMDESALRASLDRLTDEVADLEGFDDGYGAWRAEYEAGAAGYFTVPVDRLPDLYEQAMGEGA